MHDCLQIQAKNNKIYGVTMNIRISRAATGTLLLLSYAALISSCASTPDINAAYDDGADFSQYRTYNFFSDAGADGQNYQSLFTQYMITAIEREMESRGYQKSAQPDLLVNFNANFQDKTKVTTSPSMGGYYGYRGGYYGGWGGYGMGPDTHVSQYTEGTFNIDLVDAHRKQLVWEAVLVGRLKEDSFDNLEEKVNNGVPRFFAQYPFIAGQGTPVAPAE
jgi:hypothetical protein